MASPSPRQIRSAVRAFARQHDLLKPGPLVVAVSGGTDSTALALVLAEIRDEFGLVLHVAHFDHRTRPRAAAADAQFVSDLANQIDAPVRVGRAKAPARSEDDARVARYEFLRRVAVEIGATAIATGHTRDDQAETVLLHLTRGAGLVGVAAMRPLRDGIARPLLVLSRAETEAVCKAARITPREDATNRSLRFARNRVRHRVLPELERINPQVRTALARFADIAADADDALSERAHASAAQPTRRRARSNDPSDATSIPLDTLPADDATRDRALVDAWRRVTGKELGARHRGALLALTRSTKGTRKLDLPGGVATREYAELRISTTAPRVEPGAAPARTPLKRGAVTTWHEWRIAVDMPRNGLPFAARIAGDTAPQLVVRSRRPGDRIGRRKLQDIFVDAKVPARLRDVWPIVSAGDDIIWIPGLTTGPNTGQMTLDAGPAGDDLKGKYATKGRVASFSVGRQRGGKVGRP